MKVENEKDLDITFTKSYHQKIILTGLLLLVVVGSVFAISNRDKILILLKDYHEECFEYTQIPIVRNYTYEDYQDGIYCIGDRSGYWKLNCTIVNKTKFYDSTENGDCSKYHLVREVSDGKK